MKYTLKYVKTRPNEKYQGYAGYIMEIPGVCSQGKTMAELIKNIEDALGAMLEILKEEEEASKPARGWEKAETVSIDL